MKYRVLDSFKGDYAGLSADECRLFGDAVVLMRQAFAARGQRALQQWPARLRTGLLEGHRGIFEMTWSFAGPDGRATFEIIDIGGEPAVLWRRIGSHRVFSNPQIRPVRALHRIAIKDGVEFVPKPVLPLGDIRVGMVG